MEKQNATVEHVPDAMNHPPFRAKPPHWKVLIPRYQIMMEKEEDERQQRIKANAEISYNQASLPPRM